MEVPNVAGQLRPLHRVLALFDPLLGSTPAVAELDNSLRVASQIGDDKSHPSLEPTGQR